MLKGWKERAWGLEQLYIWWSVFGTSAVPGNSPTSGDVMGRRALFMWSATLESKDRRGRRRETVLRLTCQWFCYFDRIMYALLQAPAANQRLKTAAVCSLTVAATRKPNTQLVSKVLGNSGVLGNSNCGGAPAASDVASWRSSGLHGKDETRPTNMTTGNWHLPSHRTRRNLSHRPLLLRVRVGVQMSSEHELLGFGLFLECSAHRSACESFSLVPSTRPLHPAAVTFLLPSVLLLRAVGKRLEKQEPTCGCSFQTWKKKKKNFTVRVKIAPQMFHSDLNKLVKSALQQKKKQERKNKKWIRILILQQNSESAQKFAF